MQARRGAGGQAGIEELSIAVPVPVVNSSSPK